MKKERHLSVAKRGALGGDTILRGRKSSSATSTSIKSDRLREMMSDSKLAGSISVKCLGLGYDITFYAWS